MPQTALADTPTHWTEIGEGPCAVLVHAALGSAGTWLPLMRTITGHRLVAFDLPGHGQSGPLDPARGTHTQATEALAELCKRQDSGPVDVIGHGFGATVALRLAIEAPTLVRSLVLIEPVLFAVARRTAPDVFSAFELDSASEVAAFAAKDAQGAARAFYAIWGGETSWEDLTADARRYFTARIHLIEESEPALYDDAHGLLAETDMGVGVARVLCPVLLVSGTESPPVIEAIMEGLAQDLPVAERMVLAGAGHMAPLSHAETLGPAISRFLASVGTFARLQPPSGSMR
ncbi:alpha/beta fold hydrolase [Tropicimonas sp. S265A]|uniref:alpha/beta fold hydrolase n=1 Tax=Tropicimonas sp. S265A TaxID=3415134 RepID=UPI003C7B13AC